MLDSLTLYVILIVFLATLIRSAFGFGEALVGVPLLALRLPITAAAPLAILVSITVAVIIIYKDWRHIHFKSAANLLLATLVGTPVGLYLLVRVNDATIKTALAGVLLLFSFYSLTARNQLHLKKDHRAILLTCGFIGGILGAIYGMNGPPLVIYGSLRQWSPQQFRATLQAYFLPASIISLIGYLALGLWTADLTRYFFLSLPGIILATLLGHAVNRRLKGNAFFKIVYVGLIGVAVLLIVQSFTPAQAPPTASAPTPATTSPTLTPPQSSPGPS